MELLVYLIKVNVGILFLYSFYRLFLRNDTFFRRQRIFLLSVVFIAFLFPLVEILRNRLSPEAVSETTGLPMMYLDEIIITSSGTPASDSFSLPQIVSIIYFAVALGLIIRILLHLISILLVVRKTTKTELYNTSIRTKEGLQTPFSFFGWIVLDPAQYKEKELKEILLHEQTHVRQSHSFDMMLSELICTCCWFNPFVWLLKKEIRVNLEYLADQAVLQSGCEVEHYQFHLLQLSYSKAIAQITNHFNVSPLKKRIFMMNKKQTSRQSMWKYTLLVPVIALLAWFNFSLKAESPIFTPIQEAMNETAPIVEAPTATESMPVNQLQIKTIEGGELVKGKPLYFVDDKEVADISDLKSENIFYVSVMKDTMATNLYGERAKDGVVLITTKKANVPPPPKLKQIYPHAQVDPSFPGGKDALMQWLSKNLIYPTEAAKHGIQGKVFVRFVVDETGKVGQATILKGIETPAQSYSYTDSETKEQITVGIETFKAGAELLNAEALRIINAMPNWVPGKHDGKAVNCYFNLPILFRL
ncbi:cell envelope biogenesis protein TonB [Bacteroidia bacterium]|nr:cell envelope biogenesis protein TonB [Bacteroidia bacterium]